jgi:hypothetical protein
MHCVANHFSDEMRYFFDDCIDGVIELIQSQITQVENKRNRVRVGEPESC